LLAVLVTVIVSFYFMEVSTFKTLTHALGLVAACGCLVQLFQLRLARKRSGLSDDEFMLKQAGGAEALMSQSTLTRAIGWLCVVAPVLLVLFIILISSSLGTVVLAATILGVICLPCAVACFRSASRSQRVAKQAGAGVFE